MDNVTVKLTGDTPVVVFHRLMQPGETRQVHPTQAAQLEALYPGRFERVGVRLEEKRAEGGPLEATTELMASAAAALKGSATAMAVGTGLVAAPRPVKPEPQPEPVTPPQSQPKRGGTKKKKS